MARASLVIVLAAVLWGGSATAQILYADQAGLCDGRMPCFTTIQGAVNAASGASLVFVFPGTYAESVDLSGMAMPGTITLLGPIIEVENLPAMGSGTGAAAADLGQGPVPDLLSAWREKVQSSLADLLDRFAIPNRPNPLAAVGVAFIDSPTGPAIFNSVAPHPGAVSIIGLSVHSPDDDGIRVNSRGDSFAQLVQANMNGRNGINLASTEGDATFFACTANSNTSSGLTGSAAEQVLVINGTVQDNMSSGMQLSGPEVRALGLRVEFLGNIAELGFTDGLLVSGNGAHGVLSTGGNFSMGGFLISLDPGVVPLQFLVLADLVDLLTVKGNTLDGVNASATNIDVALMNADENMQSGLVLTATEQVTLFASRASGNVAGDGARVVAAHALVGGLTAAGNGATGLNLTTSGGIEGFLDVVYGAQVFGVSTTGNGIGANFSCSGAGVLFNGNAVVGNLGDGVVLSALGPGESHVSGNIICSNDGAGVRSAVGTTMVGTANWWGDPSGPSHPVKNPTGAGDAVVDGSSGGGLGDIELLPFIDTVMGSIKPPVVGVNNPTTVEFQLTGGNGSVFLGVLTALGGSFLTPPLILATANGSFSIPQRFFSQDLADLTGNPLSGFINGIPADFDPMTAPVLEEIPTVFRATLFPGEVGEGTVELLGPCGLAGSASFAAVSGTAAPVLSVPVLIALSAMLCLLGARAARRR